MWIVLDANIFFKDLRLSKDLNLLFRGIDNIPFAVRIPEIVVQETINLYKERRQTHLSKLNSSQRLLKSITSLEMDLDINEEELDADLLDYEKFLREKIEAFGEICPIPNVHQQTLITKALERRKPFNTNGEGFRDVLIWENILELAQKEDCEEIALVTENIKDFAEGDGLHSQLVDDLAKKGVDEEKVKLYLKLEDFLEKKVIPKLDELEDIRDSIVDGTNKDIDLDAIAENFLWDLIPSYNVDLNFLPYADYNDDLYMSGVSEYEISLDNLIIKRLSSDELLIEVDYELECEIDFFVPRYEYSSGELEGFGIYISERDWNKYSSLVAIVLPYQIRLRYVYNENQGKATYASIIGAECLNNPFE